jgi:hypothetical protein
MGGRESTRGWFIQSIPVSNRHIAGQMIYYLTLGILSACGHASYNF